MINSSLSESPQAHVSLDFIPQNMSVTLEVTGNTSVDVMGYVHDVDVTGLMNLKKQMGLEETEAAPRPVLSELSFEPFSVTVSLLGIINRIGLSTNW